MKIDHIKKNLFCSGELCLENNFFDSNFKNGIVTHASYKGLSIEQNPNIIFYFNDLIESIKPSRVLEIGTFHGGLTLIIRDLLDINNLEDSDILTYDINEPIYLNEFVIRNKVKIKIVVDNIFNHDKICFESENKKNDLANYIGQQGVTLVLCDGGVKKNEFNLISSLLKPGDVIMAHDYAPNFDFFDKIMKNNYWNWLEIQDSEISQSSEENSLYPFMQDYFIKVGWVCKIKEKIN